MQQPRQAVSTQPARRKPHAYTWVLHTPCFFHHALSSWCQCPTTHLLKILPHSWVVGNVPVDSLEVGTRLVHRHLRQNVALLWAMGLGECAGVKRGCVVYVLGERGAVESYHYNVQQRACAGTTRWHLLASTSHAKSSHARSSHVKSSRVRNHAHIVASRLVSEDVGHRQQGSGSCTPLHQLLCLCCKGQHPRRGDL